MAVAVAEAVAVLLRSVDDGDGDCEAVALATVPATPLQVGVSVGAVERVLDGDDVVVAAAVASAVAERRAALAARMRSRDSKPRERGGDDHSPLGSSSHRTRLRTPALKAWLRTTPVTLPMNMQFVEPPLTTLSLTNA